MVVREVSKLAGKGFPISLIFLIEDLYEEKDRPPIFHFINELFADVQTNLVDFTIHVEMELERFEDDYGMGVCHNL